MDYNAYCSFDMGGFHFVVLVPNYMKPNDEYIPYEKSQFAIITLDKNGAQIKGTDGGFAGTSPEEMGTNAYGYTLEEKHITSTIEDRYLEL